MSKILLLSLAPLFCQFPTLFGQSTPPPTLTIDCGDLGDQFFIGGSNYPITLIPGATGDLTVRFGGAFGYHIPRDPGVYLVTLNFRETGTVTGQGQRVFSVRLNDQLILDNFDLFKKAGLNPIERNYVTASNNGFVDVDFSIPAGAAKGAIVSSIVIQSLFTGPPPPPVVQTSSPIAESAICQSGDVFAGPIGPGVPPGALWPGLVKASSGYAYNCDGLRYYRFKNPDGSAGPYFVAVQMPDGFLPDPAIWVKQP